MLDNNKVQITVLVIVINFIMVPVTQVQGKAIQYMPSTIIDGKQRKSECTPDSEVLKICQRCASNTKSNIVYPLCCTNSEDARTFCVKYLAYGLHPN